MTAPTTVLEPLDREPAPIAQRQTRRWAALVPYAAGLAMAAWIIRISMTRGRALQLAHRAVKLGAAPFVGRDPLDGWDWRFGISLVGAGALAAGVVFAVWTGWLHTATVRTVAAASSVAASAFALLLALTDRSDGVLHGVRDPTEYLAGLPKTPPAGQFVRHFLADLDHYSVHVRGHPPGFVLVLKFMSAIGLDGAWPAATLSIVSVGITVAAVLTTAWIVAGAEWMRRCAPFLVVAPYAIWQVSSADAFYAAIAATGVAAMAVGLRRRSWQALVAGVTAGLLLGSLLYLTYLGVIFTLVTAPIVAEALIRRRRGALLAVTGTAIGAAAVILAFRLAGFWWVDGARRTRTEYWEGTAQFREWDYFKYANIAVLLIAIGPAAVVGLMRLRDRRLWLIAGAALAAVLIAHFSQYTRGEVERIWLLFFPFLMIGAAAVARARRSVALWVGVQAVCAIALQAALVSKW